MILLALDIDETLVGDDISMWQLFKKLEKPRKNQNLKLAYATGRSLESLKKLQQRVDLPNPDALIASVGTEIYVGTDFIPDNSWPATFNQGWDREGVASACLGWKGLEFQKPSEQRPYKISFLNKKIGIDYQPLIVEVNQKYPSTEFIVSHSGLYLDIVPRNSNKGFALLRLAEQLRVKEGNIYSAGDSNNDLAMLNKSKAIIVGNAYKELKNQLPVSNTVYHSISSYSAGIIEGLEHYLGKNWGEL